MPAVLQELTLVPASTSRAHKPSGSTAHSTHDTEVILCVLLYVLLQVVFNPKDSNTFASASLDRTVKVRCSLAVVQLHVLHA
jgi:hypothetical protein